MHSLDFIGKQYYIVDGCGNYYHINEKDQLVIAACRDEAGVFGFVEANQRIGGGRKSHFYFTIPIDECEDKSQIWGQTCCCESDGEKNECMQNVTTGFVVHSEENSIRLSYDLKSMNWEEYLKFFCYVALSIPDYIAELKKALSDKERQISDIMHYIELYDLDETESIRMVVLLKECREQRRDVKDEMLRVNWFQKALGDTGNVSKAKTSIEQIHKLEKRVYHPRRLEELFQTRFNRTQKINKLERAFEDSTCIELCNTGDKSNMFLAGEEEDYIMQDEVRQETIFDGKENHWEQFAMQQAEFYANAKQYICNLEMDLRELDDEIEQILKEIENANYNVVQGYKVFERMKEMRNLKKEKLIELHCMKALTEGIDYKKMAEIMEACVCKIEEMRNNADFEISEKTALPYKSC